ncbi:lantibiotic dehydratase [Flavobacterium sp. ZS1P70]|uniref:Lantibiotic dehydratase n=1 Tax=Flavobacterium zhoui TaxID=3230414 RepID=A0ABW6I7C5_9FLAO
MKNITVLSDKIIREPIFPLSKYHNIPKDPNELGEFIDRLFDHKIFSEAVYLASPSLHKEWEKIVKGEKDRGKINESILKYYLRSFSNTVPFGLFTTYSIHSNINFKEDFTRFTNVDMEYLVKLVEHLNENEIIRKITLFRKNNTIYKVGNHYRYIEPQYRDNILTYTLSSIESDQLLDLLLSLTEKEFYLTDVKKMILDGVEDVNEEEIASYINQLVDSKIYISCFEVSLNEENLLGQIINFYQKHKIEILKDAYLNKIFEIIINVNEKIKVFDNVIFNSKEKYQNIFSELNNIGILFEEKFVVNSNLRKNTNDYFDEIKLDKKLNKLLSVLTKLSHSNIHSQSHFEVFKKNFYNRYENQEVPLMEALDNELGIGYLPNFKDDVIFSDLIDDIILPSEPIKVREVKIEPAIYNFWLNLFMKNTDIIDLEKENLEAFEINDKVVNGTFSVTYSYLNDKLYLKHAGGASGSNLLGRFSNNDKDVMAIMRKITDFEKSVFKDKITAEIIHLPMNRAGNILIRKVDRGSEISLISKTSNNSNTIDANDLTISLRGDRIILKSKKEDKEIMPFLTSAQNYHYNSLPIYQFLCDLQTQERLTKLSLNFGGFSIGGLNHFPRLIFGENLILQNATWLIKKEECKKIEDLKIYLDYINVPQFFYITNGGEDKMIIDKENLNTLNVLFDEINKNKVVKITECIYNMYDEDKGYANEFISIFQTNSNNKETVKPIIKVSQNEVVKRNFIYGDEWVYFKIYTGRVTADEILLKSISDITTNLINQKVIDKWFFLRFTDPDFHLRIRFHLTDVSKYNEVSNEIYAKFNELEKGNKIWKIDLSTYKRELERYQWSNIENSETIFYIDSKFTINLLNQLKKEKSIKRWFFILKSIDDFFVAFDLSVDDKNEIMQKMFNSFWVEHGSHKSIKKEIDVKFRKYEKEISTLFSTPPSSLKSIYLERLNELKAIKFNEKAKDNLHDLVWSYIHMHVNRFMPSNPRFHELILYGILEKYYKKEIGIMKYNKNLVEDETY